MNLELRMEVYNLFNHPNFTNPELPNFIADAAQNGINSNGTSAGYYALGATPDVAIGNPFLGGCGPRYPSPFTAKDMAAISGQKPVLTKSKKSIAVFKLRENLAIGCKVTLRRQRMYEFLDRLVNVALPRVRDFRGLSGKSFDGRGNYALGLKEQLVFPEIDYDQIDEVRGMDIIIVTTARTDKEAKSLLRGFQLPFVN